MSHYDDARAYDRWQLELRTARFRAERLPKAIEHIGEARRALLSLDTKLPNVATMLDYLRVAQALAEHGLMTAERAIQEAANEAG